MPASLKRIYCSHGLCTSNNKDKEVGMRLLPFPKPCSEYIKSALINNTNDHNPKQCEKCSKSLKWIHLCKRSDSRLAGLLDINKRTFICTKHFPNGLGPTELDPDPYPADATLKPHKPPRRAPTDRSVLPIHSAKKIRLSNSSAPTAEYPLAIEPDLIATTATTEINAPVVPPICHESNIDKQTFVQEHYYAKTKDLESRRDFTTFLKHAAHTLIDQNVHVKCDNETLSIAFLGSFDRNHLVEKSCIVDREFKVQIFILGKPIKEDHKIWNKYPKVWSKDFDFLSFLKDLSENWLVCQSSTDSHWLTKVKEEKSMNSSDSFHYDRITDSIRSVDCTLLSPSDLCFHCKKMILTCKAKMRKKPFLTCRRIGNMSREEAQAKLRHSQVKLAQEKHKSRRLNLKLQRLIGGGATLTSSDNGEFLNILCADNTQSSDLAKIFFNEQIKAAKVKSPTGHPLMVSMPCALKVASVAAMSVVCDPIL